MEHNKNKNNDTQSGNRDQASMKGGETERDMHKVETEMETSEEFVVQKGPLGDASKDSSQSD